jgi:hypothetical protein
MQTAVAWYRSSDPQPPSCVVSPVSPDPLPLLRLTSMVSIDPDFLFEQFDGKSYLFRLWSLCRFVGERSSGPLPGTLPSADSRNICCGSCCIAYPLSPKFHAFTGVSKPRPSAAAGLICCRAQPANNNTWWLIRESRPNHGLCGQICRSFFRRDKSCSDKRGVSYCTRIINFQSVEVSTWLFFVCKITDAGTCYVPVLFCVCISFQSETFFFKC